MSYTFIFKGAAEEASTGADSVAEKLATVQLNGEQNGEAEDGAGSYGMRKVCPLLYADFKPVC